MAAPTVTVGPGQYLSQYYASKYGPSPGLDPEVEAKIRQGFIGVLRDLRTARLNLQIEGLETWGQMQISIAQGRTALVSAMAEAAKAGAMSDQAQAELLSRHPILSQQGFALLYRTGDAAILDSVDAKLDALLVDAERQAGTSREIQQRKGETANRSQFVQKTISEEITKLDNALEDKIPELLAMPEGAARNDTAIALIHEAMAYAHEVAKVNGLSDEESSGLVKAVKDRYVSAFPVNDADVVAWQHNQSQQAMNELMAAADAMSAGVGPEYVQPVVATLNGIQASIGATPEKFMANTQRLAGGPDDLELRVQRELDALDQGDPLQAELRRIQALPGFKAWMAAMNFRGPNPLLSAALYAGRNPHEWEFAKQAIAADPTLTTDIAKLEQLLREEGMRQDKGYLTRPVERFVGFAVNKPEQWRVTQAAEKVGEKVGEAVRPFAPREDETVEEYAARVKTQEVQRELDPTPLQQIGQAVQRVFTKQTKSFKPSIELPEEEPVDVLSLPTTMPKLSEGGKTWKHEASGALFYEQPSGEWVVLAGGTLRGVERGQIIESKDPELIAIRDGAVEVKAQPPARPEPEMVSSMMDATKAKVELSKLSPPASTPAAPVTPPAAPPAPVPAPATTAVPPPAAGPTMSEAEEIVAKQARDKKAKGKKLDPTEKRILAKSEAIVKAAEAATEAAAEARRAELGITPETIAAQVATQRKRQD